ncbi:MAG: hypothetical protein ABIA21_02055 [Candidatus Aenigmatarchaeota archaeon]
MLQKVSKLKFTNFTRTDWLVNFLVLALYAIFIIVTAFLLIPDFWIIWLLAVFIPVIFFVKLSVILVAYQCKNCNNVFQPTVWNYIKGPHGFWRNKKHGWYAWRYLKCPKCEEYTIAKAVKKLRK